MINGVDIREQFTYSDRCRALLRETLCACPEVFTREFPTLSKWNSIQLLVAHSMGAEERWIGMRILGRAIPPITENLPITPEAAFARWQQIRAATYDFLSSLSAGDWQRVITVDLAQSAQPIKLTVEQILFHIVNHENYHRAQVSMLLQHFGIDPPNFDYCLLLETVG